MTKSLERFVLAQDHCYEQAYDEVKKGKKISHWMWYVFPQVKGLGTSLTSIQYAIQSSEEASAYLAHPILGQRLVSICQCLLESDEKDAFIIFGKPDVFKLKSSLTLFDQVSKEDNNIFSELLNKYFDGRRDLRTISILSSEY